MHVIGGKELKMTVVELGFGCHCEHLESMVILTRHSHCHVHDVAVLLSAS
jgi:hypothetical protein